MAPREQGVEKAKDGGRKIRQLHAVAKEMRWLQSDLTISPLHDKNATHSDLIAPAGPQLMNLTPHKHASEESKGEVACKRSLDCPKRQHCIVGTYDCESPDVNSRT
jgi:hypothetical protein